MREVVTISGQLSSGLKEKMGSAVENLDSLACSGLDQLTERLINMLSHGPGGVVGNGGADGKFFHSGCLVSLSPPLSWWQRLRTP